ncbi:substrate-binding domain-containing protein [Phycicoccus sonneratiae]|uniref:VWA domain-containing protein n=1 Tax=Phycicoccus sonneratiae TaxID=2807628 RepID=A0ABS2CKX4_9MICO|nr:substrate-binding domain-containing protein [Phycicoccus sonneraticus]MBM6399714.1 VWA domain-containing protein [Phycicoccus sonneraticus]
MGRHGGAVQRGRTTVAGFAVGLLVVVGVGGWQAWERLGPGSGARAVAATCVDPTEVSVATTAPMRAPLEQVARTADPGCWRFTVTAEAATTSARRLETRAPDAPAVWVADSAPLAREVAATTEGVRVGSVLASTPVLLAVPEGLEAPSPVTWAATLVAEDSRMPDPTTSTVGSLALMEGFGEIDALPGDRRSAALARVGGMLSRVVPEETLLTSHAGQGDAAIFPTTEQQVHSAHVDGLTVRRATSTTPALEYTAVTSATTPSGAVDALVSAASSPEGQRILRAAGFRTATDPSPVVEGAPPAAALAGAASPAQARAAQQMWAAIARPTRLLNIIDTSGSMRSPADGGASRIEVAAAASSGANQLLADHNSVGLWTFSTKQRGSVDWTEVQPVRPLGSGDQRSRLAFSLGSLPTRLGGDTGLYDTVDAGYAAMVKGYDADAVNLMVLFTDGVNDDTTGGLSLAQLKARLAKAADPKRPVTVLLIGMGGVDAKALAPIASAVPRGGGGGAAVFTVDRPQDIADVYVTMLLRRLPKG